MKWLGGNNLEQQNARFHMSLSLLLSCLRLCLYYFHTFLSHMYFSCNLADESFVYLWFLNVHGLGQISSLWIFRRIRRITFDSGSSLKTHRIAFQLECRMWHQCIGLPCIEIAESTELKAKIVKAVVTRLQLSSRI